MPGRASIDELYASLLQSIGVPSPGLNPDPDLSAVAETLSTYAENIRHLRKTLDDRLDQDMAALLRRRNASMPIMRLPPEILLRIIEICLGSPPLPNYYVLKANLMSVCFEWASLGRNTPSLWSFISNNRSEEFIIRALSMSGGALLTVECRVVSTGCPWPQFLGLLQGNIGRLRHFQLFLGPSFTTSNSTAVHHFFRNSAPALERLVIESPSPSSVYLDTFFRMTPRLRELIFERVSIPWKNSNFHNLTHMTMHSGQARSIDMKVFATIIVNSPNLVHIDFQGPLISPGTSFDVPKCFLPFLRTLSLRQIDAGAVDALAMAIEAPQCHHLTLVSNVGGGHSNLFNALPSWIWDHLRMTAIDDKEISLEFGDDNINIIASTSPTTLDTRSFNVILQVEAYIQIITALQGLSLGSSIETTLAFVPGCDVGQAGFLPALSLLPPVSAIELSTNSSLNLLVDFLGRRQETPTHNGTWPFHLPTLESVEFIGTSIEAGDVVKMVKARCSQPPYTGNKGRRARSKKKISFCHPSAKPLKLNIYEDGILNMTDEVLDKLKSILGADNVTWYHPDDDEDEDPLDWNPFDDEVPWDPYDEEEAPWNQYEDDYYGSDDGWGAGHIGF